MWQEYWLLYVKAYDIKIILFRILFRMRDVSKFCRKSIHKFYVQ